MVASTICPMNMDTLGLMKTISGGPMDWHTRTVPLADVRSRRPANWNLGAEVNTAILRGVAVYGFDYDRADKYTNYLIAVPDFTIIHRGEHIEIQRNYDNHPPNYGWRDIPFADVPGDIIYDLMLCYTQMGYAQ